MQITYSETVGIIRVFNEDDGYKKRDPFTSICSVVWENDKTVSLVGALGKFNVKIMRGILSFLYDKGIHLVKCKRRNGCRMPFGKEVQVHEFETDWECYLIELKEGGKI